MPDKVTFAERLNEALFIRGLKQIELSRLIGISKSAISQYCSGHVVPKQTWAHAIALALNVSDAWLMGENVPIERDHKRSLLAAERLGGILAVLGEIGALENDGTLSASGCDVVTDLLRNNAGMLKKLMDNEN